MGLAGLGSGRRLIRVRLMVQAAQILWPLWVLEFLALSYRRGGYPVFVVGRQF